LFIKKGPKRCRFERHCRLFFSPKRAEKQGKEAAFPCIFTAFLPPFSSKTRWLRTPTCPKLSTCWRGGNTVATPSSFSTFTLHMNNGEAHCLMGWQHRPRPKWLGWVRPNSKKKFPFSKIVIVFHVFFTKFCLVFGCYFLLKKIQIRYSNSWFSSKLPKYKKTWKIEKKNVFVHTTKCLKAKNHIVFFIPQKNNVLVIST
jgi:hypothetical protein